jgi:hypothetical protein
VYQPIVRASSGRIVGVEALARWKSNGVDVPPDVFIRVAEETGLVVALGDVVLEQAARDAPRSSRPRAGGERQREHLRQAVARARLREQGRAREKPDGRLPAWSWRSPSETAIGNDEASLRAMKTLADRGVPFAIDDFGVGFSSIGYLQDMPVQIIKTDLSFSESIDRDERSCALLCSITIQPPIADIGRSGCRKLGSSMPWPGSLPSMAIRQRSASSSSVAPRAAARAGRTPRGRTGSCGPGRRR